jgi:hypothetical protein
VRISTQFATIGNAVVATVPLRMTSNELDVFGKMIMAYNSWRTRAETWAGVMPVPVEVPLEAFVSSSATA